MDVESLGLRPFVETLAVDGVPVSVVHVDNDISDACGSRKFLGGEGSDIRPAGEFAAELALHLILVNVMGCESCEFY